MRTIASLSSRLDALDAAAGMQVELTKQHVAIDYDAYTIDLLDAPLAFKYTPTATGLLFHKSDDRTRLLMGHVGSGKTSMICAEIIFRACKMPHCRDGVRRSRWAIIRNTYGDLQKTTMHTWAQWWRYLGNMRERQHPAYTIKHTFNDGAGIVEMELLPIALDKVKDVTTHLKSLEVTGVFLNELAELHKLVLDFFSGGRMRFPRKADLQDPDVPYWVGVFSDTNPPDQDSWIYKLFEQEKPEGYTVFHQPPAVIKSDGKYIINAAAENICNVSGGAEEYLRMTLAKSENFIRVYLMGEYGTIDDQKLVYYSYNDNIHSVEAVEIRKTEHLIIAADLGTVAPAILIAQHYDGVIHCIKEFCGAFTTVAELCNNVVIPWLSRNCKDMYVEICLHDPADTSKGAAQLREFFGALVHPASTNNVELRIESVARFLTMLVQGVPAIQISRKGCVQLRKGFNGKYYYKRMQVIGEERTEDRPHKNHPYSDIHDCLQYICLYIRKEFSEEVEDEEEQAYNEMLRREQRATANKITGY